MRPLITKIKPFVVALLFVFLAFPAFPQEPANRDSAQISESAALLEQADRLMHAGKLFAATALYQQAKTIFPTWWYTLAKVLVTKIAQKADFQTITQELAKIEDLEPAGDYVPLIRLLFMLDAGFADPAMDMIPTNMPPREQEGRGIDALTLQMKLARALAFERSERYQAAIREYQSILYMDRTVQVARFKLAALYKRVGRTQEATELMQEGATLSMFPARWKNN